MRDPAEGIGDRFLEEVYRLCLMLGGLGIAGLLLLDRFWALSFAIGGAVSVASLRWLEFAVRRWATPVRQRGKRVIQFLAFTKYLFIGFLFFILVKRPWLNAPALAGGLGLVYLAITLKAFWIGGQQILAGRSKEGMGR